MLIEVSFQRDPVLFIVESMSIDGDLTVSPCDVKWIATAWSFLKPTRMAVIAKLEPSSPVYRVRKIYDMLYLIDPATTDR